MKKKLIEWGLPLIPFVCIGVVLQVLLNPPTIVLHLPPVLSRFGVIFMTYLLPLIILCGAFSAMAWWLKLMQPVLEERRVFYRAGWSENDIIALVRRDYQEYKRMLDVLREREARSGA